MFHLEPTPRGFLCALRVARVATLTALGVTDEHFPARLLARQADWLSCLARTGASGVTYDWRVICQPQPDYYERGALTLALLCHQTGVAAETAQDFARELHSLAEASFPDEYEFAPVTDPTELAWLQTPFAVRSLAEIARRAAWVDAAPTVAPRLWQPGFVSRPATAAPAPRLWHVYPFLPNPTGEAAWLRLLLRQPAPLLLSVRLQPTLLTDAEQRFLAAQNALAAYHFQPPPTEHGASAPPAPAAWLPQYYAKLQAALDDGAAWLRVELASAAPRVPQTVLEAVGAWVSLPAGGRRGEPDNPAAYLSGGYSVRHCPPAQLAARRADLRGVTLRQYDDANDTAPARWHELCETQEALAAFRLPVPVLEETPGLALKTAREQPAPPELTAGGHWLGESFYQGRVRPVYLHAVDRRRHIYAVGQTGTGKTTLFESMLLEDMRRGEGVCLLDPHGDLVEKLLGKIPDSRLADVVLIDPADTERPIGLNLLEYESEAQKYFLVQEVIAVVETIMERLDPNMMGPMFFQHVRMMLLLVMARAEQPGTLLQFYQTFNAKDFYKRFLPLPASVADPILRNFVEEVLPRQNYTQIGSEGTSMGSYISSKFAGFVSDPMLRNILGQQRSTLNLREVMDSGKILLVNLSKGRLGETNSRLFGMFLIAKLQAAALSRANVPEAQRRDFYLYVDEFQNLATMNFGTLLSEARKYRLNLTLTNQFITQVDGRITAALAGNVGTTIAFRVGSLDAEYLEREFVPVYNRFDLMRLPNYQACVSTSAQGQVCRPFTMRNRLDETPFSWRRSKRVCEMSRLSYGRARRAVEEEIADSLAENDNAARRRNGHEEVDFDSLFS